jgi:hypothetical protein
MTKSTASLEHFDFLELLYLLSGQGRSGALWVYRPDGRFQAWLEAGQVVHLQFGEDRGAAALTRLLLDPCGRFHFDEGLTHPTPGPRQRLDELALEALEALPGQALPFSGPARITSPERVAAMRWSLKEQDILRQIEAQRPVEELALDPDAQRMLLKLHRINLITPRRSRVARLTVTVTREVRGVVVVDEVIFRRWQEDLARQPQHVAVKAAADQVYTLPVRPAASVVHALLVPTEVLMRTGLRAGDSVLVRPA